MAGWASFYQLLQAEIVQRRDEGCSIPSQFLSRVDALDPMADRWNDATIAPLYEELMTFPVDPDLAENEPNDLSEIIAQRPAEQYTLRWKPNRNELVDRLHGAWTGRCVGCALGKPVEQMGMSRNAQGMLDGRSAIKQYLERRNEWPLTNWFSKRKFKDDPVMPECQSYRETIAFMEPDDDIHYSLAGLAILETYGINFTWQNVASYWLSHIPYAAICTAETQAILNVMNSYARVDGLFSRDREWISSYRNPYREWIGAQIRSDGFAFCCAGDPQRAAELAWRDASWTHRRNGIYGEMMFAAMQSAAFVESDPHTLVSIGLSCIPEYCRLAKWIKQALNWVDEYADFESCMGRLEDELGDMHAIHTINNAMICVIAICYGKLDTTRTPAIAVMCGLDTDCNGASTGSIAGAISGRAGFGGSLAHALNDTIKPTMIGFQEVSMHSLAERTADVWERYYRQ